MKTNSLEHPEHAVVFNMTNVTDPLSFHEVHKDLDSGNFLLVAFGLVIGEIIDLKEKLIGITFPKPIKDVNAERQSQRMLEGLALQEYEVGIRAEGDTWYSPVMCPSYKDLTGMGPDDIKWNIRPLK